MDQVQVRLSAGASGRWALGTGRWALGAGLQAAVGARPLHSVPAQPARAPRRAVQVKHVYEWVHSGRRLRTG